MNSMGERDAHAVSFLLPDASSSPAPCSFPASKSVRCASRSFMATRSFASAAGSGMAFSLDLTHVNSSVPTRIVKTEAARCLHGDAGVRFTYFKRRQRSGCLTW